MTYRISLPALDPARVATTLAALTMGLVQPVRSGIPGTFLVQANRVAIEIYPDDPAARMQRPMPEPASAAFDRNAASALRFPLSVPLDRMAVERLAAEAGWHTRSFGRGMLGQKAALQVIDVWIENRILAEVFPLAIAHAAPSIAAANDETKEIGQAAA